MKGTVRFFALLLAAAGMLTLGGCALRLTRVEPIPPAVREDARPAFSPEPALEETHSQPSPEDPLPADPEPAPAEEPPLPAEEPLTEEQLLEARAQEILADMTLEQKIGQMFFVRCPEEKGVEKMAEYQLGGYLLFLRDFKDRNGRWLTAEQLDATLAAYREAAAIAPFFGVDEEGGTVARASRNPNLFAQKAKSPQTILSEGGEAALLEDAIGKNSALLMYGINVNFAPVADVTTDQKAFMYARAMGADAETTARLVRTVVAGMKQCRVNGELCQIGSVLKHFPGYGNNPDTHTGGATDRRSYETYAAGDFLPFLAGIEAGADAVLVCHNVVTCMDDQLPASLSPEVHRVLREELGFDGVIMTDDLWMAAVAAYDAAGQAAVMAIQAGNDLIVTTDFEKEIAQVVLALEDGTLTEARLEESVLRILKWKLRQGVVQ